MKPWKRLIFALAVALLAGAGAGGLYVLKSSLSDEGPARAHGEFRTEFDGELFTVVSAYAEKKIKSPGQTCVSHWVGRDDRYVYLAFGCAKFFQQFGHVLADGDQGFRALRIRHWWGNHVFGLDQANTEDFHASMRTLFPHRAAEEWWKRSNPQEFLSQGLGQVTGK